MASHERLQFTMAAKFGCFTETFMRGSRGSVATRAPVRYMRTCQPHMRWHVHGGTLSLQGFPLVRGRKVVLSWRRLDIYTHGDNQLRR